MEVLIAHALAPDVLRWLGDRLALRVEPQLADGRPERLEQIAAALSDARAAFLPTAFVLDDDSLREAPRLRVVARLAASVGDAAERSLCARLGIEVVRGQAAAARSEAEFTLAALITLLRPAPGMRTGSTHGRELSASTVGLVGMSHAARTLAMLLRPLQTRVIGYDPLLHADDPSWSQWQVTPRDLRDLLAEADAVVLGLPAYTRYRGLLGERLLELAKPHQVWVSLASASIFDAQALATALREGRLQAVWLDDFDEHDEQSSVLVNAPGLIVTPRLAADTQEAAWRREWLVARQVHELLHLLPDGVRDFGTSVPSEWLDGSTPGLATALTAPDVDLTAPASVSEELPITADPERTQPSR